MKVSQLIKQLEKLDPNTKVILQMDPEGNGYHDARGVTLSIDDGDGNYYDPEWTADECCLDEGTWEDLKNSKENQCVVVYP